VGRGSDARRTASARDVRHGGRRPNRTPTAGSVWAVIAIPGRPGVPARLLVADDHAMLRSALCDVLRTDSSLEIVAEAGDGEETVSLAEAHRPDLILLDVEMPGQPVCETVRQLRLRLPRTKVLILTMYDDQTLIRELMALGVCAYLHKSATRDTLLSALRLVATTDQQVVISVPRQDRAGQGRTEAEPTSGPLASAPLASELSAREVEVLGHVATAMSNRQIASRLGITEATVKRHLRNIFAKLGAVSRIDAVNKAKLAGLSARRPAPWGAIDRVPAGPTSSLRP
jgi:two-component system, NarL family, nitrate/nitrite response regulator NarL